MSSLFLALMPFFVGLSQLVTIESILIFFFTAAVFAFIIFLENFSTRRMILVGILLGLALLTKYTNILLVPIFLWAYVLWYFSQEEEQKKKFLNIQLIFVALIASLTFFILWPAPWFHLGDLATYMYSLRVETNKLPVPEVFFGRLLLVPKVYYLIYFLITTPLLLLLFFLVGLGVFVDWKKNRDFLRTGFKKTENIKSLLKYCRDTMKNFLLFQGVNKKNYLYNKKTLWIFFVVVAWFGVPFIQSLYNFRQHGVRYIIEIYVPFCLIAGVGYDFIAKKFMPKIIGKVALFVCTVLTLFLILRNISPYYLDYFNSLVGGTKGVYEKRLFQLGWWGQGIREASLFLAQNAAERAKIGIAAVPLQSVPKIKELSMSLYKPNISYDYVLVSYFNVVREGFDDSHIRKNYAPVYFVKADGANLLIVYKRK